jgi:hypothetical protein
MEAIAGSEVIGNMPWSKNRYLPSPSSTIESAFAIFDTNVPLLAVNFPPILMPSTVAARKTLLEINAYFGPGVEEDASGLLKEFVELGQGQDWTTKDQASFG